MKIALVILNWNGVELLKTYLPSVTTHSPEATVYLADNNSTDNSIEFVKSNFPEVKLIKNTVNGGYAKGYNDALRHINADIFCLINNDVEVTKNWLNPITKAFKENPKTAIIQPKILDAKRKQKFEYAGAAGGFIDKYAYPFCRGRIFNTIETDNGQYNDITPIFWASGACLFIRKPVFETLNGFDERFFAHMEEIDLCWRTQNLNYNITYVGTSTVYHLGGATLAAINPKKTYLNFRNSLFTLVKNSGEPLFPLLPIRLVLDGLAAINFLVSFKVRHTFAVLRAHISFYAQLPYLIKARKRLKKSKKYYAVKSIAWQYYVSNKKTFSKL